MAKKIKISHHVLRRLICTIFCDRNIEVGDWTISELTTIQVVKLLRQFGNSNVTNPDHIYYELGLGKYFFTCFERGDDLKLSAYTN